MAESAYMRVYEGIRKWITNKTYDVDDVLPAEPELEKHFGVSRTTVRRAIEMLVREGYLSVRQGSGTRVTSRKAVQSLNRFSSISESLAQKGHRIGLKSCYIEKIRATAALASLLSCAVGETLFCIHRVKTSDGAPVCLIKNYIPERLVPGLDGAGDIPLLYEYLKKQYSLVYSGSKDVISASAATFEQAQLLGVEPKTALFHVRRVCYMGYQPCELDEVDLIAEHYEYEVFMGEVCD